MQSATPNILLYSVWPLSLSLAATKEIDVSFSSSSYLDVSVQRVSFIYLWIQYMMTDFYSAGFPHSDICGSMDICSYPQLFAACHVLRRLLMPSHSPYALISLTLQLFVFELLLRIRDFSNLTLLIFLINCSLKLKLPLNNLSVDLFFTEKPLLIFSVSFLVFHLGFDLHKLNYAPRFFSLSSFALFSFQGAFLKGFLSSLLQGLIV